MEYKNDKSEFIAFVEAGLGDDKSPSIDVCLECVTKDASEDFLKARAELYRTDIKNDNALKGAFKRLAVICNEAGQQCAKCPVC